jgi:hypothetical protein
MNTGSVQDQLLAEQRAYYSALAPAYLDQGLEPADLERRLRTLGWDITVTPTAGPFFWGAGTRAPGTAACLETDPGRTQGN